MVLRYLHRLRWFFLGFGLAGLHHENFFLNLLHVVITCIDLYEIVEGSEGVA